MEKLLEGMYEVFRFFIQDLIKRAEESDSPEEVLAKSIEVAKNLITKKGLVRAHFYWLINYSSFASTSSGCCSLTTLSFCFNALRRALRRCSLSVALSKTFA